MNIMEIFQTRGVPGAIEAMAQLLMALEKVVLELQSQQASKAESAAKEG